MSLNGGRDSKGGLSLNGHRGSIIMRSMVIDMNDEQVHTLARLKACQSFLSP